MKILGTVCARGGSKGVPNKNIRLLCGKPLIAYTIEYLKQWGKAEKIVCSTDSETIAAIAKEYGAEIPYMRPAELATDTASKLDVLQHLVAFCEQHHKCYYDLIVDLDPTAPLRKKRYLDEAFDRFTQSDAHNLYSVCKARKNPYFNMVEVDTEGYAQLCKKSSVTRRQDAKDVYELNASLYIYTRDFLLKTNTLHSEKTLIYKMPEISSIDIDREIDFLFVEFLIQKGVFTFDS
jgi:CMP-N-acetylneuraminic acid synthetase